jgi:chromosome segregation ATPase
MAETSTFGIKMDNNAKEAIQNKITASGMTAAEYINAAVAAYEAGRYQETIIDDKELKSLAAHTTRINEIYVEICRSRQDEKLNHELETDSLESQLISVKAELVDSYVRVDKELKKMEVERDKNSAELELLRSNTLAEIEVLNDKLTKASEERDYVKSLLNKVDEVHKQAQEQVSYYKTQCKDLQTKVQRVEHLLGLSQAESNKYADAADAMTGNINVLEYELSRVKADRTAEVRQLQLTHKDTLLQVKEEAFEQRKADLQELERLRQRNAELKERISVIEFSGLGTKTASDTGVETPE